MDLTRWLATFAARRAHVFIAEVPGNWALRAGVQDMTADRGWCQALSPADADVLAVCGAADDEFVDLIDRIWDQVPGPRARVDIADVSSASAELDRAAGVLIDVARQRADAAQRERSAVPLRDHGAGSENHHMPAGAAGHGRPGDGGPPEAGHDVAHQMEHGSALPPDMTVQEHREKSSGAAVDHGAHQHHDGGSHASHGERAAHAGHDMGHSGHHMDHGDMDMAPAGIALAQGGEDRDGLEMDELHVRLGPFLAYWPAGLVLRCVLQGDVITAAEVQRMGAAHEERQQPSPEGWLQAARHTDYLVDLLMLAGWPRAVARARQLRKTLLDKPIDDEAARKQIASLTSLIHRSRVLRWSLRGLAPVAVDDVHTYELPAGLAGDTYGRLLTRLDVVQGLIHHEAETPQLHMRSSAVAHMLPALVEGLDLATARLVIAGLGIDTSAVELGQHA
ncbi:hypothetical protein [Mycolicibacterium cosmeticum]|uniref:hypothetical protein n=1 Tax=Mycolicibacterium cosmeticum TaxID=258533 RepID=UPI0032047E1A